MFAAGVGNTLLQWPGGGIENAATRNLGELAHEPGEEPRHHRRPDSLEELVNVVTAANGAARPYGPSGPAGRTPTSPSAPGYVIETDAMANILTEVTSDCLTPAATSRKLVHVEGGIKLYALNAILDDQALGLKTMGGSSGQSIAGVLSTSVHGMDVDRGPIPDMVRAIHLVGPGGVQHWIEPRDDPITTPDARRSRAGPAGRERPLRRRLVQLRPRRRRQPRRHLLAHRRGRRPVRPVRPGRRDGLRSRQDRPEGRTPETRSPATAASRSSSTPTRGQPDPDRLPDHPHDDAGHRPRPGGLPVWLVSGVSAFLVQGFQIDKRTIPDGVGALTWQNQIDDLTKSTRTMRGFSHTLIGGPDPAPLAD